MAYLPLINWFLQQSHDNLDVKTFITELSDCALERFDETLQSFQYKLAKWQKKNQRTCGFFQSGQNFIVTSKEYHPYEAFTPKPFR